MIRSWRAGSNWLPTSDTGALGIYRLKLENAGKLLFKPAPRAVGAVEENLNPRSSDVGQRSLDCPDNDSLSPSWREDPASMLPGTKGIAAEPAPQCGAAHLCHQAL